MGKYLRISSYIRKFDFLFYQCLNKQWSLGEDLEAPAAFPAGMLGIHFPTDTPAMINEIGRALSVFAHGLNSLYLDR
jgi:hypothetical protein